MSNSEDQQLIAQYKSTRDLAVLANLFKRYDQKLFRTCMKYLKHAADSEDACVDMFLLVREQLLRYDVENFGAWLYTLCRNHCIKKLKERAKSWTGENILVVEDVNNGQSETHKEKWLEKLPEAIDELSEEQRSCVILFYLHGKSYKEVSAIKGYTTNQVRSYIQHGKIKLKKLLSAYVE